MFVDEYGANLKTGIRKVSWLPVGVTPVLYILYNCSKWRVNILPTYTVRGVLVLLVYNSLINIEGYDY